MEDKRKYLTNEEKRARFRDRFANDEFTGVNKLTAVGCSMRFQIPRDEMYLTERENRTRNFEYDNRAEREERRLLGKVATLLSQGNKLRPDESLEDFVERMDEDGQG